MTSLTVAISTHGGYARYLGPCVKSALLVADEVIVYDDGGECATVALPESVRYVALPKSGYCIDARKMGIAEASCEWILHLDADDWLLRRPTLPADADMTFSDMYLCDDSSTINGYWKCDFFPRDRAGAMDFLRERRTNPMPGKSCYRVSFLVEHGLSWYQWPNTTFGEDVRTIIEYLKHAPRVVYVPESGYYVYRFHEGQDTQSAARRGEFLRDLDSYLKGDG
jgi:glycosyltransferase involved in cell wall biosynthesis